MDLRLYVILDKEIVGKKSLVALAKAAIAGGATMLQYRDKVSRTREIIEIAAKIRRVAKNAHVPLVINDRVDIALAIGAEGVHLGQDDMLVSTARHILGNKKIIGVSAGTIAEARKGEKEGADYIGAGPVFATKSKKDAGVPLGLAGLADIVKVLMIPTVAIGGITIENAKEVMATGVSGIAVISAIMRSTNPEQATRELLDRIRKHES